MAAFEKLGWFTEQPSSGVARQPSGSVESLALPVLACIAMTCRLERVRKAIGDSPFSQLELKRRLDGIQLYSCTWVAFPFHLWGTSNIWLV